jgi:prepilin-type N-terminal cleavage/methylation domain-containing protein
MKRFSQLGFTLAEMLVVIALTGLLTIMVMANFKHGNYSNDLRQASTELLQNIRLAQNYTIGGNSINYCSEGDLAHRYHVCTANTNTDCCSDINSCSGICKNGVPQGGYGIVIYSTDNYKIFGDTNNDGVFSNPPQYSEASDYIAVNKDISAKKIHIKEFELSSLAPPPSPVVPSTTNFIVVRFSPPEGTVHFYNGQSGAEIAATTLTISISSDNIPNICRHIVINSVSGQVSEGAGGCNL